mmetsp:Transcript_2931/g.6384  ORF Transcript_2931/g.6384 Transcript_2931/m.6384 type:complete len:248 (-) Transcript_2931:128-871(-)
MGDAVRDPFHTAKDEVEEGVRGLGRMREEWLRLLETENTAKSSRFQELGTELSQEMRRLDTDLIDLSGTIQLVEKNRDRFPIDDAELEERRAFVKRCRADLQSVQDSLNSKHALAKMESDQRDELLRSKEEARKEKVQQTIRDNDAYMEDQRLQQRQILRQQDDELIELARSTQRIGDVAEAVNVEIKYQERLLDELGDDIERENERLNAAMKGVGKLLQTSDNKLIYLVVALFISWILLTALAWWA